MEFGPLSETDANLVRALLQKEGRDCVVRVSQEHVDQTRETRRQNTYFDNRTFQGADAVLFIEVERRDLLIVRGLLEKMGHKVGDYEIEEIPEEPEYLCPKCKYCSREPGLCPKHGLPLLDFSAWYALREAQSSRTVKIYARIFFVAFVIMVIMIAFY